jgi:hypothetical protein
MWFGDLIEEFGGCQIPGVGIVGWKVGYIRISPARREI